MKNPTIAQLWHSALIAWEQSVQNCRPVPMVVQQHKDVFDDNSPVVYEEVVMWGVCWIAWLQLNYKWGAKLINYLKAIGEHLSYDSYRSRWTWSNHKAIPWGQSLALMEAYYGAISSVLYANGIAADMYSNID